MSATNLLSPLRMNPPMEFATRPTQYTTEGKVRDPTRGSLHATTSSARITAPVIIIPGHEPLTTTLTPKELFQFLPILHLFIEPPQPNVVFLPAASVSYIGLKEALRWRETELQQPEDETATDLIELVQIYQALAFLGNNSKSFMMRKIGGIIHSEIEEEWVLPEYQELWELRFLPFTEPFIKTLVQSIARIERAVVEVLDDPSLEWDLSDFEYAEDMAVAAGILRWAYSDKALNRKVERMRAFQVWELQREARNKKRRTRGAIGKFKSSLSTVME